MESGGDHPYVFMVVGPIQDPPNLKRYDMGIEGRYPLYSFGMRAGAGTTYFKFKDDPNTWYELGEAVKLGKFKQNSGKVLKHLRGYIKDALSQVTDIRVTPEVEDAARGGSVQKKP